MRPLLVSLLRQTIGALRSIVEVGLTSMAERRLSVQGALMPITRESKFQNTSGRIPLVRAGLLLQAIGALRSIGQPIAPVLRRAGVDEAWQDAEAACLIPTLYVCRLFEVASAALGIESFGSLVGGRPVAGVGRHGQVIVGSLTAFEALNVLVQRNASFGNGHPPWLADDPGRETVWLCRPKNTALSGSATAQFEMWALRSVVEAMRMAAGPAWRPARIRLCSGPEVLPALRAEEAFRGVPTQIGQGWGGIEIPRSVLALPLTKSRPLRDPGAQGERATEVPTGTIDALREVAASLCEVTGSPSLEALACAAGLHPRTLQRMLAEQEFTVRRLVDQARFLRARQLMQEPDRPVTDIAFSLGYSDSANFTRAFRRWAGMSPSSYRRYARRPPSESE